MSAPLTFQRPTQSGEIPLLDKDGDECGSVHVDTDKPLNLPGARRELEIILLSQLKWSLGVKSNYLSKKTGEDRSIKVGAACCSDLRSRMDVLTECRENMRSLTGS